jgi:cytidylate kinase
MGTYIPRLKEYERDLLTQHQREIQERKLPSIAIGGFSGTGKDTVALYVKEYFKTKHNLELKITHAGEFVRKVALESGWEEKNMDEFMEYVKNTQDEEFANKIDLKIEKRALKTALLQGGIFVGRMAPFAIGTHGITIWLEVSAQIIAERISNDRTRSEFGLDPNSLVRKIQSRDRTDGERLERIYNISFRDKKKFDLTLRNEGYSLSNLKIMIYKLLSKKYPPKN